MFKNVKIVSGLLIMLVIIGVMQFTCGAVFFHTIRNDKDNFSDIKIIRQQQSVLSLSWEALLQTRLTLNRASTNYMVDLVHNKGQGRNEILKLMNQADISLRQAEGNWNTFKALPSAGRAKSKETTSRHCTVGKICQSR